MTTAEATHRQTPTPGDLAQKQVARRLAALLAPGVLTKEERFRPLYDRGIRTSSMTPHTRLVAWALLSYANARTGEVKQQPRLEGLMEATGLNAGQVVVQLRALEQRGWLQHTGSPRYEDADLRPVIPSGELRRLRSH
ncbi:hypothetical protein BX257_4776 [Streptomyces sp. 3212.3]|uniref:hypothetical protein n=1 Tax=Streptomyces sp. 3212.3 TaxID=1938846 RepID=UPI000E248CD1|nr:hypothetical protein [Streptomyces sp. 3212.3]REE62163.1 hypothetical protein BX257_4776 [Streptomyces sp. 3212.3]